MAVVDKDPVLRFTRKLALQDCAVHLKDSELLQSYVMRRDEHAFAALVRRHGAMVLRACGCELHNEHDAEDAFQATFLVLSRKAASVQKQQSVGSWLFGVARRVAKNLKRSRSRRRVRESQARELKSVDPLADISVREAQAILYEELDRLPERYRSPLVLCTLEGLSRDEAARRLGWPLHRLKYRLERARKKLRERLGARGFGLSGALVGAVFCEHAMSASLPATLSKSTIEIATPAVMTGYTATPVVSARVANLTEGVLKTMFLNKVKIAAKLLLAVAVLGIGTILFFSWTTAAGQPQRRQPSTTPKVQAENGQGALIGKRKSKPLIIKPGGAIFRMAWGAGDKSIATVSQTLDKFKKQIGGKQRTVYKFNSTVKFWDGKKGKLKLSLGEEKKVRIESIAFSPDGKLAAIAALIGQTGRGDAYEVRLMEPPTGAFKTSFKQPDTARVVAFTPNGKLLAVGGAILPTNLKGPFHRVVRLWDTDKGKVKKEFKQELQLQAGEPYLDGLRDLAFSPNGKFLATADADAKVRLQDVRTGKVLHTLEGHTGVAFSVKFSPDGKTLATGSFDQTVMIWDVKTGKKLRTLEDITGQVRSVAFSPDGKFLAAGADDLAIWETATWRAKKTLRSERGPVVAVAFSPGDGNRIAVAGGDGQIRLWQLRGILAGKK